MHPAVKFFQRFQAGLLADVISSLVWTLAGDQQCANKLPEKCGPLCDARVEEKEVQISLIVARHESEGVENVEGQGDARRCVLVEGQAAVPNEIVVPDEVLVADQEVERERNLDRGRTLPRSENGSELVMISGGGSIRVEFEDLALADIE